MRLHGTENGPGNMNPSAGGSARSVTTHFWLHPSSGSEPFPGMLLEFSKTKDERALWDRMRQT